MSFSGAITTIESHLTAAGAAVSPAITTISAGEPAAVTVPTLAWWYLGWRPWEQNTLAKTQVQEGIAIRAYFPGSIRVSASGSLNSTLESRLQAIGAALRTRVWGDVDLGTNATGIGISVEGLPLAGWTQVGSSLCRITGFDLWFDVAEPDPITQ